MNKIILILIFLRFLFNWYNLIVLLILAKNWNYKNKENQNNYNSNIYKSQINGLVKVIIPIGECANLLAINPVHEFKLSLIS